MLTVASFFGVVEPFEFGSDTLGRIGELGLRLTLDLYSGSDDDEGT